MNWSTMTKWFQNNRFKSTNYSTELDNELLLISKSQKVPLFNPNHSPYSNEPYSVQSILSALLNQCYNMKINNELITVTCNPFHEYLRKETPNKQYMITRPAEFIDQLAKQLTPPVHGMWNIINFYCAKFEITDVHISLNQICFKKNGQKKLTICLTETCYKECVYFIKITSHLDPSITKKPQDGACQFNGYNINTDIRVATIPIFKGEMISLRLFHKTNKLNTLESLGFSKIKTNIIRQTIANENGLILITGTTGSGKSTTLYAILKELKHRHVITMEDPIEKIIPGIYQTHINSLQGFSMESGLKAMLRHNPDVIAIGEIRDKKSAELVLHAAYTGHLVIASLHTNSIEATLLRLDNLGLDPFLISYCLRAIISQRLIYTEDEIKLKSAIMVCQTPHIIHDVKKELQEFMKHNILIK